MEPTYIRIKEVALKSEEKALIQPKRALEKCDGEQKWEGTYDFLVLLLSIHRSHFF